MDLPPEPEPGQHQKKNVFDGSAQDPVGSVVSRPPPTPGWRYDKSDGLRGRSIKKTFLMDVAPAPVRRGWGEIHQHFLLLNPSEALRICCIATPINAQGSRYDRSCGLRGRSMKTFFGWMWSSLRMEDLPYLEPYALMGIEIRQLLQAPGEICQKSIVLDLSPHPQPERVPHLSFFPMDIPRAL